MPDTITVGEIRDLLKREKIPPSEMFSKEDFIKDEKLIKAMAEKQELEDFRSERDKKKIGEDDADSMIPDDRPGTLTEAQKRQQEKDNEFVADGTGDSDDPDDLIPD